MIPATDPTRVFTEVEPTDPAVPGRDHTVVGAGSVRRFTVDVPDTGNGGHAFVDVAFHVCENPGPHGETMRTLRRRITHVLCHDRAQWRATETYRNTFEVHYAEHELPAPLDPVDLDLPEEATRTASERFDPAAELDWDGHPGSERPCELITARLYANGTTSGDLMTGAPGTASDLHVGGCVAHGHSLYEEPRRNAGDAMRYLACDKGRQWVFLIDVPERNQPSRPRLVSLTGLHEAAHRQVEADYYGHDDTCLRAWHYAGVRDDGTPELVALTVRRAPDRPQQRGTVGNNEAAALMIYQDWQVVGPDGTRYLEFTVALNGDA